jgi:predicted nucleic acid-binding protein
VRVFLDANVLFSASNSGSNIARLIRLLLAQGTPVTSDLALEESRRNLEVKWPGWSQDFATLSAHVEVVPSVRFELSVELADKDVPILCAAIQSACQVLVTGDKQHFGHLYGQTIEGVQIVSLAQLATMLTEGDPE